MWCESTYSDCDPSGEAWRKKREDDAKKKKQGEEEAKKEKAGCAIRQQLSKKSNNRGRGWEGREAYKQTQCNATHTTSEMKKFWPGVQQSLIEDKFCVILFECGCQPLHVSEFALKCIRQITAICQQ